MKKLLFVLLILGSISTFASEVRMEYSIPGVKNISNILINYSYVNHSPADVSCEGSVCSITIENAGALGSFTSFNTFSREGFKARLRVFVNHNLIKDSIVNIEEESLVHIYNAE